MKTWIMVLLSFGLAIGGCSCSDTQTDPEDGGNTDGPGMDGQATDGPSPIDAATDSVFLTGEGGSVLCPDGEACECDDGIDNETSPDGFIDGFDPECTGPYDDDESSFATGIPGDNQDPHWQDCFFDGNSGGGDDGCRYRTECLTGEYDNTQGTGHKNCQLSQQCIDFCAKFAPNGCDCFGCCAVATSGGTVFVRLGGETCSLDNIDDTTACPRCVQNEACGNSCGTCELCLGKTVDDLPAECFPDGGTGGYTCDGGETVCSSSAECLDTEYCYQGCCLPSPV